MIVKLMAEESSATDPTTINMSDYSSISSSEGDYTDPETAAETGDYFLFQNVRKIARRRRRKMAAIFKACRFTKGEKGSSRK